MREGIKLSSSDRWDAIEILTFYVPFALHFSRSVVTRNLGWFQPEELDSGPHLVVLF
jgi:hypothetical protein